MYPLRLWGNQEPPSVPTLTKQTIAEITSVVGMPLPVRPWSFCFTQRGKRNTARFPLQGDQKMSDPPGLHQIPIGALDTPTREFPGLTSPPKRNPSESPAVIRIPAARKSAPRGAPSPQLAQSLQPTACSAAGADCRTRWTAWRARFGRLLPDADVRMDMNLDTQGLIQPRS